MSDVHIVLPMMSPGGRVFPAFIDMSKELPLKISPSSLEFAVVPDAGGVTAQPVNCCMLSVQYNAQSQSSSASSLLTFSVRASAPKVLRIKGGWGQLLSFGEVAQVKLTLRKGLCLAEWPDLRIWVTYELLEPGDTSEFSAISKKWKEQRKVRGSGGLVSSNADAALSGTSLWKGRNFDLLNSHSIVVPCRITSVQSARTAENDMLRDHIRLRRAQLNELQQVCDGLLQEGSSLVEQFKNGAQKTTIVSETKPSWSDTLHQIEWMEVVGLMLVVSSTALLAISL